MSSATVILPLVRTPYFRDRDDVLATTKRSDEIVTLSLDWTDQLETAETVSSIAYSASGPTTSSPTLATPVSTVTVTGVGELTVTATLSTGRKLERVVRYYEPDGIESQAESDYDE
jgi:hypothetical protein